MAATEDWGSFAESAVVNQTMMAGRQFRGWLEANNRLHYDVIKRAGFPAPGSEGRSARSAFYFGEGIGMRWFHSGIDGLYVALAHGLMPPLFRHGHASPPLRDHLAAVDLQIPPLIADGRYTLTARTLGGDVRAGFRLRLGSRAALPVLIYHHGLGEMPFDRTFRFIFPRRMPVEAHLVAVRAPFHRSHLDCCRGLATLNQFLAMCAVSVALVEALRSELAARGAQGCLVAGTSLGGFVTLLHHLTFGSASGYAPLLAGPDLAYTLLVSPFRRFVSRQARAQSAHLSARLNFRQEFRASDTQRVFPLLAQHDLCMPCAHHRVEYAANGIPVTTIGRGHMTGSLAFAALRAHLLACLARLSAESRIDDPLWN